MFVCYTARACCCHSVSEGPADRCWSRLNEILMSASHIRTGGCLGIVYTPTKIIAIILLCVFGLRLLKVHHMYWSV